MHMRACAPQVAKGHPVPLRVDGYTSPSAALPSAALARGTADAVESHTDVALVFADGRSRYGTSDGLTLEWDDGSAWRRDLSMLGTWCGRDGQKRVLDIGMAEGSMTVRDGGARVIGEATVSKNERKQEQIDVAFTDGSTGRARSSFDGQTLSWDDDDVWHRSLADALVLGAWVDDAVQSDGRLLIQLDVSPDSVEAQHAQHCADMASLKERMRQLLEELAGQQAQMKEEQKAWREERKVLEAMAARTAGRTELVHEQEAPKRKEETKELNASAEFAEWAQALEAVRSELGLAAGGALVLSAEEAKNVKLSEGSKKGKKGKKGKQVAAEAEVAASSAGGVGGGSTDSSDRAARDPACFRSTAASAVLPAIAELKQRCAELEAASSDGAKALEAARKELLDAQKSVAEQTKAAEEAKVAAATAMQGLESGGQQRKEIEALKAQNQHSVLSLQKALKDEEKTTAEKVLAQ